MNREKSGVGAYTSEEPTVLSQDQLDIAFFVACNILTADHQLEDEICTMSSFTTLSGEQLFVFVKKPNGPKNIPLVSAGIVEDNGLYKYYSMINDEDNTIVYGERFMGQNIPAPRNPRSTGADFMNFLKTLSTQIRWNTLSS